MKMSLLYLLAVWQVISSKSVFINCQVENLELENINNSIEVKWSFDPKRTEYHRIDVIGTNITKRIYINRANDAQRIYKLDIQDLIPTEQYHIGVSDCYQMKCVLPVYKLIVIPPIKPTVVKAVYQNGKLTIALENNMTDSIVRLYQSNATTELSLYECNKIKMENETIPYNGSDVEFDVSPSRIIIVCAINIFLDQESYSYPYLIVQEAIIIKKTIDMQNQLDYTEDGSALKVSPSFYLSIAIFCLFFYI